MGSAPPPRDHDTGVPLEIERTYLLAGLPPLPERAVAVRIEQGYLPEADAGAGGDVIEGRLRRAVGRGGKAVCTHTVKTGQGLVRREVEREVSAEEFEALWPRTAGRRLSKTRYLVAEGDLVWEIDDFDELNVVLADIELPSPDTEFAIPDWLTPHIVRDVTEEPAYRNSNLALHLANRGG